MLSLIIKRILLAIPVLWIVASITFMLVRIVPGGPFEGDKALPPEIVANLKAKYHLDKPVPEQYLLYMERIVQGDLGLSYKYIGRSVNDILADAFPVSLQLGMAGLLLAICVGVPLGTIAAVKRGSSTDFSPCLFQQQGSLCPVLLLVLC